MKEIIYEKNEVEEKYRYARNQIEHRGMWLGLIYDEMIKAGIENTEEILRAALKRCGHVHGAKHKGNCADPNSCIDFQQLFFAEAGKNLFNMDEISSDYDNAYSTFHYCSLVEAWQKLGFDQETIAKLCDITMDGDRGIAEAMGLKLDLSEKIADGCGRCKLHFHK